MTIGTDFAEHEKNRMQQKCNVRQNTCIYFALRANYITFATGNINKRKKDNKETYFLQHDQSIFTESITNTSI